MGMWQTAMGPRQIFGHWMTFFSSLHWKWARS